jgi:hypothetical protein
MSSSVPAPPRDDRSRTERQQRAAAEAAAGPTIEDDRRSPWRRVSQVVILLGLVGIVVMWFYAFFGEVPAPARLDDRTFPTAAEPICARARAGLDRLPRAFESRTAPERADVVDQGTALLTTMVGELRAAVPAAQPHRDRLNAWLDDWDVYLRDRRDYTSRLRTDPMAKFYVTQSERDRRQINSSLDNFAKVNAMASCATPEDVV